MEDGYKSDLEQELEEELDNKNTSNQSLLSTSTKKRRSVQKRVVSIPISEAEASRVKGSTGEGAPPSDYWTWRKYGQKPIKGSPYPRGYYRCSSSKGCPARKQVERSHSNPSTIIVTYSFDHNHPWPLPKNHHHPSNHAHQISVPMKNQSSVQEPVKPDSNEDHKFSELIGHDDCSDELLYGSVFFDGCNDGVVTTLTEWPESFVAGEDDSMFDELDELPEYAMVFRRGLTSESWVGPT